MPQTATSETVAVERAKLEGLLRHARLAYEQVTPDGVDANGQRAVQLFLPNLSTAKWHLLGIEDGLCQLLGEEVQRG